MRSIRLRLLVGAVVGIVVALTLAGVVLVQSFDAHLRRHFIKDLEDHLVQLIGSIELDDNGKVVKRQDLSEPEFRRPFSGYYWQVTQAGDLVRSRSLWDSVLETPGAAPDPGVTRVGGTVGPDGKALVLVERSVDPEAEAGKTVRISVAVDPVRVDGARRDFAGAVILNLALLGLLLAIATWFQVGAGLSPLKSLADRLDAVRAGSAKRVEGDYPQEVEGLVGALNRLIDKQDEETERARGNAAKLGHGLKTPLAVLSAEARSLREQGQTHPAETIDDVVAVMNAHVVRSLASARAVGPRAAMGTRTPVKPALEQLISAMRRLSAQQRPTFALIVEDRMVAVGVDRRDFDDILGNLLDNARKWARSRVLVTVAVDGTRVAINIEDDGPGIPEDKLDEAVERGTRFDRTVPGTGVGLSIVKDLVELNGGDLTLARAEAGGLRATIRLPVPGAGRTDRA